MANRTPYELEIEREIEHDQTDHPARHKKRKSGGKAEGHTSSHRLDRHSRRQAGGLAPGMGGAAGVPLRPGMGGVPAGIAPGQGAIMPTSVTPRPMGAVAPALMGAGTRPAGFKRGGSSKNGEKWIPGQGVEQDAPVESKSRGRPVLEDSDEDQRMKRGGKLTAGERQSLPKSDFALPGRGEGPKGAGSGSYPIPDESHARNALSRVSQHGSPSEKATVRAKVKAKYPEIGAGED